MNTLNRYRNTTECFYIIIFENLIYVKENFLLSFLNIIPEVQKICEDSKIIHKRVYHLLSFHILNVLHLKEFM